MYRILSWFLVIVTFPLWLPVVLYASLTAHWTDTVPSNEDIDDAYNGK